METKQVSLTVAREIIQDLRTQKSNEIVHISFEKKDGSIRNAHAGFKVKKDVKGTGPIYDPSLYDQVFFFEMRKKTDEEKEQGKTTWRTLTLNKLISITRGKVKYEIED